MNLPIRSFLALTVLTIVLAACGTTVAAPGSETPNTPSAPATPTASPEPTEPAEPTTPVATPKPSQAPKPTTAPAPTPAERDVAGVITVYPGIASGPGGTIAEALANPPSADLPTLVNGVIFRDTDGRLYLASSVSDATVPTFDAPMLEVLGYPNDGESWDMKNAELLGLEEANGIIFKADAQILGTIEAR